MCAALAGLDAPYHLAALLLIHHADHVRDEPALSVGGDFLNRAVGDNHGRLGVLAGVEELLERRATPGEATDLPAHDVVVRPSLDGVEELAELFAAVVGPGLSEVDVTIDVRDVGVHVDPLVDTLLLIRTGSNVGGDSVLFRWRRLHPRRV